MAGEQVLVIDDSPTILRVVQLVLSKAGYTTRIAADGEDGLAMARAARPDLILLDFVMPKLNGYQVCRALAEDAALREVPVVLMSAKGDQVGERFVKVMGIVDYITKPFSPDAITAVVSHVLAKYARPGGDEGLPPALETRTDNHLEGDGATPLPVPLPGFENDSTSPHRAAAAGLRKIALDRLREAVARTATEGMEDARAVVDRIRVGLTDELLEQAVAEILQLGESGAVLQGDLHAVPLGEVLGLLAEQRQTGILAVSSLAFLRGARGKPDAQRVEVHFRSGKIDFVGAIGLSDEFLIGRFLVGQESLARQDLDLLLQSRGASGRLLGEQLVKLNYITPADLRRALSRQSAERLYEALRWTGGRFGFRATADLGLLAEGAALGLSLDTLLLEGCRRIDEWHVIEREIDDFDALFLRNEEAVKELGKAQLTREELAVLDLVSGKNSVRDIVKLSLMGSFEVSKMLFRLRTINLIRRRVAPVAV